MHTLRIRIRCPEPAECGKAAQNAPAGGHSERIRKFGPIFEEPGVTEAPVATCSVPPSTLSYCGNHSKFGTPRGGSGEGGRLFAPCIQGVRK